MIDLKKVDAQLFNVGMRNRFFARPEVKELCHILAPNEMINHAVVGQYEGGFALMVATDRRALLIDKKPWFLTMEDIRYDMISEVDYCARMLDATLSIITINKTLAFTSWRKTRLRDLVKYIQHRVMELRHIDDGWSQPNELPQNLPAQSFSSFSSTIQPSIQDDFASSYKRQIQVHSLAHVAGKMATDEFLNPRPFVKPLYLRPSLIAKYKHSGFTPKPTTTH
ncbi:MAG: PH domain-containing protein [Candidatus Saccharimonadales bacterium]